jgi:hypothetical protein
VFALMVVIVVAMTKLRRWLMMMMTHKTKLRRLFGGQYGANSPLGLEHV